MSNATYDALATYLEGNSGDIRTSVNAEQANLLATDSVTVARRSISRNTRRENLPPLSVEVVPVSPWQSRKVGVGYVERDYVVDMTVTLRSKATSDGKAQLNTLEDIARALVARYDGKSNLSITVTGATFVRSDAHVRDLDGVPQSHELAKAVVRATFTFLEALGANT